VVKVKAWWIFYRKIFLYSLLLTGLAFLLAGSLADTLSPSFFGFTYAFLSPFVHLFFYELGNPREYYFYANLGLSRIRLRLITAGISLVLITLISLLP